VSRPTRASDVLDRLRRDPRVDVVVRAFVAQRLGLLGDDAELLGPVFDRLVYELVHRLGPGAALVIQANRLLEHLDAVVARAHPVDLSYPHDPEGNDAPPGAVVATVLTDDEAIVTAALQPRHTFDPLLATVLLEVDDREVLALTADDAEALAYALLRLVEVARDRDEEDPT